MLVALPIQRKISKAQNAEIEEISFLILSAAIWIPYVLR